MFSNEVKAMAVKKSAPKSSAKAAKAKAAPKKAAPKKTAPKRSGKAAQAPKAGAKKAAPKKAPAIKLTDPQRKLLGDVAATKDAGVLETKSTAKMLGALLSKKLIKKGKKEGSSFRYHITKTGEKHAPAAGSSTSTEPSSPMS
jgi:hypothetical protein